MKEKRSQEQVVDQIVLEQFLKTLPEDVRVFVRERSPGSSEEAAKLADDHLQARKEYLASNDGNKKGDRRCLRCGKMEHMAKDCQIPSSELPREQEKGSNASMKAMVVEIISEAAMEVVLLMEAMVVEIVSEAAMEVVLLIDSETMVVVLGGT